jgi:PIN like domain
VKVFCDHNISPAMARALRELFQGQHEVTMLQDKFRRNTPDIEWIGKLSQEGNWIVLSGDRRITRNRAEYNAFRGSALTGIFLAPAVYRSPVIKQMERILALWGAIETVVASVAPGAMFELPITSTKLRQIK